MRQTLYGYPCVPPQTNMKTLLHGSSRASLLRASALLQCLKPRSLRCSEYSLQGWPHKVVSLIRKVLLGAEGKLVQIYCWE